MDYQTQTLPAPVTLPDAKPSDLIESLSEDRWTQDTFRRIGVSGTRYCSMGILLEHGGFNWSNSDIGPLDFLQKTYGIRLDQAADISHINDKRGKDAVVAYLRERGM